MGNEALPGLRNCDKENIPNNDLTNVNDQWIESNAIESGPNYRNDPNNNPIKTARTKKVDSYKERELDVGV